MEEQQGARPFAKRLLRKAGLYPLAAWALRQCRRTRYGLDRRLRTLLAHCRIALGFDDRAGGRPHAYDVICLPVVRWGSRIQRPQQLMRQFADRGHRVFYASVGFHNGKAADVWPVQSDVFEVRLPGTPDASLYLDLPSDGDVDRMATAIDQLRREQRITSAVIVIQLPFWTDLAERLRETFGWPIVYDCMDDHAGFSTNCEAMTRMEDRTIAGADLVVATSDALYEKVCNKARRTVLIRNACDYDHFAGIVSPLPLGEGPGVRAVESLVHTLCVGTHCLRRSASPSSTRSVGESGFPRRAGEPELPRTKVPTIVGYYGAIADWFDADLVADLAEQRPDWKFELIGSTGTCNVARMKTLRNVTLLGEKPYADLPRLVAGWDCFIVPFRRTPLTEATNPVKVYEMLATGKPVVAVNLPELRPMAGEGLVSLADNASGFAQAIEQAVTADCDSRRASRRAFAARNTWQQRCDDFEAAVRDLFPLASIIVVTYNNLCLNQACLRSIFHETDYPNFEVIVVDNASTDGTAKWLAGKAAREPRLKLICNSDNRGYAAANNQALRAARGEFLALLNNDTVVTRGWLATLIRHLRQSPGLGMVGPVSNMVGNEAIVPVEYKHVARMPEWADRYCRQHDDEMVPMDMLGFFCVVLRKAVYQRVGELDERFGLGYFEDDDYCRRVRSAGYKLCFARDAFVHHHHRASFKLLGDAAYQQLFDENHRKYEEKWDAPRQPRQSGDRAA